MTKTRRWSLVLRRVFIVIAIFVSVSFWLIGTVPGQSQTTPQPSPTPTHLPENIPQKQRPEEVSEDDVLKVTTNLVTSNALVIGRDRKFLPTLRREDFHIFENGVEQEIAYFAPVDRPFSVTLVIDNSRSTTFELQDIKNAAVAFINNMRPGDRAVIVSLTDDLKTIIGSTSDREGLTQAISKIKPAGATPLYDTVEFAIKQTLAGSEARKAVILLTDGVDNDSRNATYQSNLNDATNSGVLIYAVQFSTYRSIAKQAARFRRPAPEGTGFSRVDYQRADAYLHQMTELTGAALYPASDLNDLDKAMGGIAEELHNEYTLGFYPRLPGKRGELRRLDVRVNQPWLTVRSRTSYSFGPALTTRVVNKPVEASLSEIEPRSSTIPENKQPLNAHWMCKGPFVPGDYALVKEGYDAKCPPSSRKNDSTNAWFIRRPGPSETVCKGFLTWNGSDVETVPIPSGYAVVGETTSLVCSPSNQPQHPANAWKVVRPTGELTVCKGFLIPRGFVIVNEKQRKDCPATSTQNNAWIIVPRQRY